MVSEFSKVVQIFIVKVPNESAILVDYKNMHIDEVACDSPEIQSFEVAR